MVMRGVAMQRIVLLAGFKAHNTDLSRQAGERAMARCPQLSIAVVFSDGVLIQKEAGARLGAPARRPQAGAPRLRPPRRCRAAEPAACEPTDGPEPPA